MAINGLLLALATALSFQVMGDDSGNGYRSASAVLRDLSDDTVSGIGNTTVGPVEYSSAESFDNMWRVAAVVNNKSADHGICVRTRGSPRVRAGEVLLKWSEARNWASSTTRYLPAKSWFRVYYGWSTKGMLSSRAGPGNQSLRVRDSTTMVAWRATSPQDCLTHPTQLDNWFGGTDDRMQFVP